MLFLKTGQARQQPFGGQRCHQADGQDFVVVLVQQAVGGKAQILKCRPDAGQIFGGLWRQHERTILPDEQANSKFFLQPPDLMADGGLGDVQLQRGIGEAEMPCSGLEGP